MSSITYFIVALCEEIWDDVGQTYRRDMVQRVTFMNWIDTSHTGEKLFPGKFSNCPGEITIADIKPILLFNKSDDDSINPVNMILFYSLTSCDREFCDG